jgi:phospholipid/cholesterol/gamma-HCH transport system ATP-binding protein
MEAEMNGPVVVRGLRKSFGEQTVLNGIDLTVEKGETVAVLGRSGSGKSVLLRLIIGLQRPDSGSIRVLSEEITGLDADRLNAIRKKIGFLFQQSALYDSLTVEQNVAFPLSRHTKLSAAELKDRVRGLLSDVGMNQDLDKLPSQISGGMQKRVGLARALALDPELLLFDEPMAGLDPITAAEIGALLQELKHKRKTTSVLVTHDIHSAKRFSDRFVLMNGGRILIQGTFADLKHSRDPFAVRFMKEAA